MKILMASVMVVALAVAGVAAATPVEACGLGDHAGGPEASAEFETIVTDSGLAHQTPPKSPQTVLFQVDGEGLADGEPIPGWDLVFGGPGPIADVEATSDPIGIHSGNRGVRVNGDYAAGKELDTVAYGSVTVDYWHYPKPGTSTNSMFGLRGGSLADHWQYVNVWKNDEDLWWVNVGGNPTVATYSGEYTHIVITIDTDDGSFDLHIDEQLVYQGTVNHADKIGIYGIRYVNVHSGRGGSGTDSYYDDILITASFETPVGGTMIPTDKLKLLMPWIVGGAAVILGIALLLVWNSRRRTEQASG